MPKYHNVYEKLRTSNNTFPTIRTMVSDQSEPELIDGDLGGGGCDKESRLGILTLTSRGFEARLVTSARYAD